PFRNSQPHLQIKFHGVDPLSLLRSLQKGNRWPVFALPLSQLANRRIDLGQTIEDAMAQPAQQPTFDDTNRSFHFRLLSSPGLQFVLTLKPA
ncbi:hypothetical protein, partial [Sinorhizobium meliloti]|uniref:hypothetical protein n=1 Tax=Rhizobium meliloti TaxID=382 RepID=UPI001AECDB8A